jgi:hypothetical protein
MAEAAAAALSAEQKMYDEATFKSLMAQVKLPENVQEQVLSWYDTPSAFFDTLEGNPEGLSTFITPG